MGNAEQLGNDAAVRWLAEQEWSNGAVGMIGKSYDGSTPWQAAMFGVEHDYLKTIVPISGLIGVKELMAQRFVRSPSTNNAQRRIWLVRH